MSFVPGPRGGHPSSPLSQHSKFTQIGALSRTSRTHRPDLTRLRSRARAVRRMRIQIGAPLPLATYVQSTMYIFQQLSRALAASHGLPFVSCTAVTRRTSDGDLTHVAAHIALYDVGWSAARNGIGSRCVPQIPLPRPGTPFARLECTRERERVHGTVSAQSAASLGSKITSNLRCGRNSPVPSPPVPFIPFSESRFGSEIKCAVGRGVPGSWRRRHLRKIQCLYVPSLCFTRVAGLRQRPARQRTGTVLARRTSRDSTLALAVVEAKSAHAARAE
ncbi:hypothetical protein MSAN_00627200 [Mycena sanguinolenta]|uniref:Uncharacterized protein n=1 Tax=Mycena sanguinolenta TaxID=230812 RepID=A0A8H7DF67_9AGAR|nr:hypothetical protein MSAN_00627200 [Mycena sanguinolenta]